MKLHELATCRCVGMLAGPGGKDAGAQRQFLPASRVRHVGLADDEAMMPVTLRGLSGTRLMQEYFAFPQRFLFLDIAGLRPHFAACTGNSFELVLLFDRYEASLEGGGEPANFSLNCVPAINLFERRAERIAQLTQREMAIEPFGNIYSGEHTFAQRAHRDAGAPVLGRRGRRPFGSSQANKRKRGGLVRNLGSLGEPGRIACGRCHPYTHG